MIQVHKFFKQGANIQSQSNKEYFKSRRSFRHASQKSFSRLIQLLLKRWHQ